MQVGDLVKFFSYESDYAGPIGLVMRIQSASMQSVPVVSQTLVYVQWPTAYIRYPERLLRVISECR